MKKNGHSFLREKTDVISSINNTLNSGDYLWIGLVIVLILMSFILVNPHISVKLFPSLRKHRFNAFIKIINTSGFDMHKWNEFRDRYSPGYFTYDKQTLSPYSILQFQNTLLTPSELFTYHSQNLQARDYLGDRSGNLDIPASAKVLYQDDKTRIYTDKEFVYLNEVLPDSQLKHYNGLIQYDENPPVFTGLSWVTEAVLK